ncbi:class I SAM-dependent methyltransferase [Immundisolibacter sp.]
MSSPAISLSPLVEALGVTADQIEALLAPFVTARVSRWNWRWQAEIWRRRHKALRRMWRDVGGKESLRHGRSSAIVQAEYADVWARAGFDRYDPDNAPSGDTPWLWRDQCLLANTTGATRWRQLLLIRAIEKVRPRTVVEIGCGNGINLMMLACRFPQITFTGIELTPQGHAAALAFQNAHGELPTNLRAFAPEPLPDPGGFRRVTFLQGSATDLPFQDGAFDLAITVLALEQMEQIRARALAEIARVVRSHALMIEPFRDVNEGLWQRLNVRQRGYFRGRIAELADFGLQPLVACADFPQKYILRAALVLSARGGQASGANG